MKSGYLRAFMGINTFKNYFQYEKDICGCLWVFILLKIIVSMKKGYVDVWGMGKNEWGLYMYFFKVVKMSKVYKRKNASNFLISHYSPTSPAVL